MAGGNVRDAEAASRPRATAVVLVMALALCAATTGALTGALSSDAGALPLSSSCPAVGASLTSDGFHPIATVRVLDSRLGQGPWAGTKLGQVSRPLTVAGVAGIPGDATAIDAQVTVTGGTASSALRVWKSGDAAPAAALFGFAPGQTFVQSAGVAVGTDGTITFANDAGAVDVIVDVRGYYASAGAACSDVAPAEVLNGSLANGETRDLAAPASVPATATAVVVRLEATTPIGNSYVQTYPAGGPPPVQADLILFGSSSTSAPPTNVFPVARGTGGRFTVRNQGAQLGLRALVVGYFDPTGPQAPPRSVAMMVSSAHGPAPLVVSATATAIGGVFDSYTWDWGDGSTPSVGATPAHTFTVGGAHRIRLTARAGAAAYVVDVFVAMGPTVPGAPTGVTAVPGVYASAVVSWAPAPDGGLGPLTSTVTSEPGGLTCTTTASSCTVHGLDGGKPYTFTVTSTNSVGTGPPSLPSAPITAHSGFAFHPLASPQRVLDSRTSLGGWGSPLLAGAPRSAEVFDRDGRFGAPNYAVSYVLNVTVTNGTLPSYLTAWSYQTPMPASSTVNYAAGQTIANLVTVTAYNGPLVTLATAAGAVDVIVDVVGYYDSGNLDQFNPQTDPTPHSRYNSITPTRVLDSRTSLGDWPGPIPAGTMRAVPVTDSAGSAAAIPDSATAVIANVTATNSTKGSFLSVWPTGKPPPVTSTVNFGPGQTIANQTIVAIGAGGQIEVANAVGVTDVVIDIVGYFDASVGAWFHPLGDAAHPTTVRFLDDRFGTGVFGPWGPGQTRTVPVTPAIPATATSVVANFTATNGTAGSFLSAFAAGTTRPQPSNLNFGAGETVANVGTVRLGPDATLALFNAHGTVDLVGDVMGYFASY
jgi:hypothetical protein